MNKEMQHVISVAKKFQEMSIVSSSVTYMYSGAEL